MKFRKILLLALALAVLSGCGGKEDGWMRPENATLSDAILYTLEDGELRYNVTCSGNIKGAVITDESGSGIDSPEELGEILGIADVPNPKTGTDPGERTLGMAVTADIRTGKGGKITELTVKSVAQRPVIGISWKSDQIGEDYQNFAQALERNGALAVYLPLLISEDHGAMVLSQIDGLFVTGGEDWNPKLYGQEPMAHGSVDCNDIRDASDLFLIREALRMDIPMLTVCRGTQGLNIALGGSLIQDVPTYLGEKVREGSISESRVSEVLSEGGCGCEGEQHYRVQIDGLNHEKSGKYHSILGDISPNSKWLYDIFGTDSLEHVSTAHHQALNPEALGEGLTVVAVSSDGIIEAVEYRQNLFVLGLQWHPEKDALADTQGIDVSQDDSNKPLRALVMYAAKSKNKKTGR